MEKRQLFLAVGNPVNKCGRIEGRGKSALGKQHRGDCCRQDFMTDARIFGMFEDKRDLHSLKLSFPRCLCGGQISISVMFLPGMHDLHIIMRHRKA